MRTGSHRLAGSLVAAGFVAGWLAASWVSPPAAATQVAPPRAGRVPADVPIPRIALDTTTAPETTPETARNPFLFSTRRDAAQTRLSGPRGESGPSSAPAEPTVVPAPVAATPAWRVIGIASDALGHHTAVMSGGGEVLLLSIGDGLPDGSTVAEIDAGGVVLTRVGGEQLALRLP